MVIGPELPGLVKCAQSKECERDGEDPEDEGAYVPIVANGERGAEEEWKEHRGFDRDGRVGGWDEQATHGGLPGLDGRRR